MEQQTTQATPDVQALLARIAELEAKNVAKMGMKVSPKGGLSVYGLGKWPVTLYSSQWKSLLAKKEDIMAFIEANKDKLSTK